MSVHDAQSKQVRDVVEESFRLPLTERNERLITHASELMEVLWRMLLEARVHGAVRHSTACAAEAVISKVEGR